ncbi:MAG: shikimate dehydrogenase [Spirochaetia bacterium]|nr:shikimate dehydrogenase [Spirochaetia bacterium]
MHNIDSNTKIYGIIGYPLGHTFSPAMHNAAFKAEKINAVYLAFAVKNLINLKTSLKKLKIQGLSITIPHKIKINRILDKISPLAVQIGSVNTIYWNKEGLLEGHNTDGIGAIEAIKETRFNINKKNILIIGTGGSARAIAMSLLYENPQKIGILSRNINNSEKLIKNLKLVKKETIFENFLYKDSKDAIGVRRKKTVLLENKNQLKDYDLIINTTPIGMKGFEFENKSPISGDFLFSNQIVFDIVYNPQETPLIKICKKKKIKVIYGYKMLLYQAAHQFKLFTGKQAPLKIMEKSLKEQLK